jgi:threonine dehydratase
MEENDINIVDLSNDRLSKRHLRHMVGGRPAKTFVEKIYRFDFPERPGALTNFLTSLNNDWDISLFHYRNHGASTGHVLCGFKVDGYQFDNLEASLSNIGYPMTDETENIAYDYFLRN